MRKIKCFLMMQFKGELQDLLHEKVQEAIKLYNERKEYKVNLIRADLEAPLDITSLEDHLKKYIDDCDIAIADISQLNPNVLFEMGYAIGVNKPVIIMVREDVKIPADFRGRLFLQYKTDEMEKILPQILQGYIKGAIDSLMAQQYKTTFLVKAFANRSLSDFILTLNEAKKQIDILTTNLSSFSNSKLPGMIEEKIKEFPDMRVRILTLDPESDFAAHRARQLNISPGNFRDQLRNSLAEISQYFYNFPEQCRIAIYNEFPTQITYRIYDTIYTNVVSANRQSRNNIFIKLSVYNAEVSGSILSHFDTVWGRSTTKHRDYCDTCPKNIDEKTKEI